MQIDNPEWIDKLKIFKTTVCVSSYINVHTNKTTITLYSDPKVVKDKLKSTVVKDHFIEKAWKCCNTVNCVLRYFCLAK